MVRVVHSHRPSVDHDAAGSKAQRFSRGLHIRNYGRDVLTSTVGRNLQFLVTLITLPIIARSLGPSAFAQYAVAAASYFFGSAFLDMGITSVLAGRVASASPGHLAKIRTDFLWMRIVTGCMILALGIPAFWSEWWFYVWIGLCAGALSSSGEEWLFVSRGRFGAIVAVQWYGRVLYLVLLVGVLQIAQQALVPIFCLAAGNCLTSVLSWRKVHRIEPSACHSRDAADGFLFSSAIIPSKASVVGALILLRTGLATVLTRFSATGYTQSSALLVSVRLSGSELGLFSASDRALRAMQGILDSFVVALVPRMAKLWGSDEVGKRTVSLVSLGSLALGSFAGVCLFIAAPWIVAVLYGAEFFEAVDLLRAASLIVPVACVTNMLTTNILQLGQRASAGLWVHLAGLSAAIIGVALLARGEPLMMVAVLVVAEVFAATVALALSYRACATRNISQ